MIEKYSHLCFLAIEVRLLRKIKVDTPLRTVLATR
jgi:hypothetical protein